MTEDKSPEPSIDGPTLPSLEPASEKSGPSILRASRRRWRLKPPTWTDIIQCILMAGLIGVTIWYVSLTHDIAEQAGKQVVLAREPVLRVLPEKEVRGPGGWKFSLSLQNGGIADVIDVEVYDDCFVVLKGPDNRLGLYHFVKSDRPAATIPELSRQGKKEFDIDFSVVMDEMTKFYASTPDPGTRIMVLRIVLNYRRAIDGQAFSSASIYLIPAGGDLLLEYPRLLGLKPSISREELKAALGVR